MWHTRLLSVNPDDFQSVFSSLHVHSWRSSRPEQASYPVSNSSLLHNSANHKLVTLYIIIQSPLFALYHLSIFPHAHPRALNLLVPFLPFLPFLPFPLILL